MIKNLTLKLAYELVDKAIALKGEDFVYEMYEKDGPPSCQYVSARFNPETQRDEFYPGCIVGTALLEATGVDLDTFYYLNVNDEEVDDLMYWMAGTGRIKAANDDAMDYLTRLQSSQDLGRPWGEANEQAKLGRTWSMRDQAYRS